MLKINLNGFRTGSSGGTAAEVRKWDGEGWNIPVPQPPGDARSGEDCAAVLPSEPGWYRIRTVEGRAALDTVKSGAADNPGDGTGTAGETGKAENTGIAENSITETEERVTPSLHPAPFRLQDGTKWGYIGDGGRTVIEPRYEYAEEFQPNGLAVVQREGRSGLIDSTGKEIVKPAYAYIGEFSQGRAPASDDKGYLLIDESGKPLTGRRYQYLNALREGRALFAKDMEGTGYRYGYLDRNGREVIPAQYEDAHDFQGGKALVKLRPGAFALIGKEAEIHHSYEYPFVGSPGEGLLPYQATENGPYGYIGENGQTVIAPSFTSALPFFEGRAVVNTAQNYESSYGLIDTGGRFVIPSGYQEIQQLGENRVALGKPLDPAETFRGTVYTIADADNGRVLNDHPLRGVNRYSEGYASVNDEKETYFIDKAGRRAGNLPAVSGTGTLSFSGRLIRADVDQRTSYYNRSGKRVWTENKVIGLRPPYSVQEIKFKPDYDYLVYYPVVKGISDPEVSASVNGRLKELSLPDADTGGKSRDYSYTGDFSVSFFRKYLLQLELEGYRYPFGAAHGMPTRIFTPIDLRSGVFYELKDLFKPVIDYTAKLSEIVGRQIKNDPQYSYVFPDAYKGIAPDQPFHVDGQALYLYFAPYEIAPYAAGFPTFRIPFAEIMGLINTEGAFWRSFH